MCVNLSDMCSTNTSHEISNGTTRIKNSVEVVELCKTFMPVGSSGEPDLDPT